MSGWINYSDKVISQKIRENEMGNRGSKSVIRSTIQSNIAVKEQRADGRRWIKTEIRQYRFNHLRCALRLYESINISLTLSKLKYNINHIFSKSNISLSSTSDKPKVVLQSSCVSFSIIGPALIGAFINKFGFAALLKGGCIIIIILLKIFYYYIGIIMPLIFIIIYPFIYSRFINLFVYCFIKKPSDKNRIKAKLLKFATYNWLFIASLYYIFIKCISYIILVKWGSISLLVVIVCILMLFMIYKRKSLKIKLFRLYNNNKNYLKLFLLEKLLLIVGLKIMILLNLWFFGSLVNLNYFEDNCIIVFIHTALCTNLLLSIYALYIDNISLIPPIGLYFKSFKSMTMGNSSYLFFKDKFLHVSKNNRFLVGIQMLLWGSPPVSRAALLSEENVIELLSKKLQLTTDFIIKNISLSKENIEALDELLDLTIDSKKPEKYALVFVFGGNTKAILEKALKYTFCPNKVNLFEKKGIFLIKDNAKNYVERTHEQGKNSIYVYGDRYLFKMHEEKSMLTQNKILYVKNRYGEPYLPYDPGVQCHWNKTLYIKTLNSEFKELDIKTPKAVLGETLHLGRTSKVVFFVMWNDKFFEREWTPERSKRLKCPLYKDKKGWFKYLTRSVSVKENKFLINNNNSNN